MSAAMPVKPPFRSDRKSLPRLWRLGWIIAYALLPFGNFYALDLLILLGAFPGRLRAGVSEDRPRDGLVRWTNRLALAFLVLAAASAIFSSRPWLALMNVIGFALLLLVFYFGAQLSAREYGDCILRMGYPLMMTGGVITCLISLARYHLEDLPRASIFSAHPNSFATILIILAGLGVGYLVWRGGRWRYLVFPNSGLIVYTLLMTKSRGGWVGFAAMAACIGAYNKRLIPAVLALVLIFCAFFIGSASLRERLISAFVLEQNLDRVSIWGTTMNMIRDRPLTGVGLKNFSYVYERYAPPDSILPPHAHNIFLSIASEMGLPALAIFTAFMILVFVIAASLANYASPSSPLYQSLFAVLIGVMVHQQVDAIIRDPDIGCFFWMLAGVVLGLYTIEKRSME